MSFSRTGTVLRSVVLCASLVGGFVGSSSCNVSVLDAFHSELPLPDVTRSSRMIPLEGAVNSRDIGGYRTTDGHLVRWGILYRSGQLSELTDGGCAAMRELGLMRVIDFRNRLLPSPLFGGDVQCVFDMAAMSLLPVRGGAIDLEAATYVATAKENADSYRKAFELIANRENLPLLYHCAGGKDRTGIMTALLLTLAGVDRKDIIDDYLLSSADPSAASPQAIVDLLSEVDRQGGIENYLLGLGISLDVQQAVRSSLVK